MMDLTSKSDIHHDQQLTSWAQKEVAKHTNNCEYAEWIIAIENVVQKGDDVRSTSLRRSIIDYK
jgi:hypothetical protein